MRCVVSISLDEKLCEEVEKQMKKYKYSNKSEFVRYLLRFWLNNKDKK